MRWGSGQVVQVQRKRGPVWYAHYRDPSGRQHQRLIGPVWTGRGRPAEGHYTRRGAEDWLRDRLLEDAQRSASAETRPASSATFAEAAEEYLRYAEEDRGCKPSTIRGYRSQLNAHLLPAFGAMYPRERWRWFEQLWSDACALRKRYRLPLRSGWWADQVQVETLAAFAAWVQHYDSGEWDDPPGKLALLYDLERVAQLLKDGTEPFRPDRDRLAFARYLIDLGCQLPPDDPKAPAPHAR